MAELVYIDSSTIEAIGYDPGTQELQVQFRTGATYIFQGVPLDVHEGLMSADSKGSYFNRVVKPNYQNFTKA